MYKARKLRARDLALPMVTAAVIFIAFIYIGYADMGWLIAMSVAIVGLVASMYRESRDQASFYLAIVGFLLLHVSIIVGAFYIWTSLPVKALSPLFLLDFVGMGLLFPKLTGISFDAVE